MTILSGKKKIAIVGLVAAAALAVAPRAAAVPASASTMARTNSPEAGALSALCCWSPVSAHVLRPGTSKRATPLLQRIVKRLVRDGAPGALAEVRTRMRIRRAAAGVSQRQPSVALRVTGRFRAASITKSFVATVVLELAAEGKLSLDDTVEHWLPGAVPNGAAITLRELLNHTSGLFDYGNDQDWNERRVADPQRIWLPEELMAVAVSHRPYFPPGTDWHYSNTDYVLLGLIIEKATGRSLGDELNERIFQPLALSATSFPTAPGNDSWLVHAYIGNATIPTIQGLVDVTPLLNPSWSWAAGALVSNADDLTTFYARLLSGRILRLDLVTAMRTVTPPAEDYGLGLMRIHTPCGLAFGHRGDYFGYRSEALSRPNGNRVALVMVNVDTTNISWAELDVAAQEALCSG
jgi:D-alanyl-D-alanine carboxypeptidase